MCNQTKVEKKYLSNYNREIGTTRPLSPEQVDRYHENGFVIIPSFFEIEEIKPLQEAFEKDPDIRGNETHFLDSQGYSNQIAHWAELGDSLLGCIPRLARIIDGVEVLLGGQECYHWYSKIVKKRPHSKGSIEWHQDYGSWYYDTFLFSDMLSVFFAVNEHSIKNGCVKVIKKSHLVNRIDHIVRGEALVADPIRIKQILQKLEVFNVEMKPGDVMFIHSNTIHSSNPNNTDNSRINLVCTYSAVSNEPIDPQAGYHRYKPLEKLPDSWILDGKYNSVFDNQEFLYPEIREITIRGRKKSD
ncbi:phytanoyl-CoA dioxygenase family protein [Moorena sp. SIO4G3]|uniref:phytanoyl-CoA dioxygenase family protein n=1 Tax=Moorena sp. SIO4G3 TaxID=2607821 RepID=UPI00142B3EAB|nr:phytanoyl-CoA dioxygenase family protein [Moorena sp. SIO4G3]NEO82405.1 phytanoyl-CoA dioxygenase family protein [Moorena sp. SIO4G3]